MNATAAVDHVFAVLGATYGTAWDRSLGTSPINDVKTVWGDALGDFLHTDDAKRSILWALKNLPDTVPNARQFRTLCRTAPSRQPKMLSAPAANPEIVAKVLGGIRKNHEKIDFKQWARVILDNTKGRTPTVIQMAKDALRME